MATGRCERCNRLERADEVFERVEYEQGSRDYAATVCEGCLERLALEHEDGGFVLRAFGGAGYAAWAGQPC